MEKTKVTKDLGAKTLTVERTFAAPKYKLWRAYADKDWFVQWWGPEGWETMVKEFDFKPGGRNHYVMRCVDGRQREFLGQESWGIMQYEAVNEPDSLTYKDYFADADGSIQTDMPALTITIELVEKDGQTTVISRLQGDSAEAIEKLLAMGMVEGYASSADRLERLVTA